MEALLRELIPHAPHLGLYVTPHLPGDKVKAAMKAYGGSFDEPVIALYDATRFGSARDGALFGPRSFLFHNLIETPQRVAYLDLIRVWPDKKLLGGQKLRLQVNRARATFDLEMDFAARTEALPYVQRFLETAQARTADREMGVGVGADPVEEALLVLEREAARLTADQRARLQAMLRGA